MSMAPSLNTMNSMQPLKSDACSPSDLSACKTPMEQLAPLTSEDKPYRCLLCQESFEMEDTYQSHVRSHLEKDLKPVPLNTSYQRNNISKVNAERYVCDYCHKIFADKKNLVNHLRIHTGEQPYKCEVCEVTFDNSEKLRLHKRKHTGGPPHKCKVCNLGCQELSHLRIHMRLHTGERPYKCSICPKAFTVESKLVTHMQTHTTKKPYPCEYCDKSFRHEIQLRVHTSTHTGLNPYTCDCCKISFQDVLRLRRHMKTHLGERKFQCSICSKNYVDNNSLTRHMKSHTGERPYACSDCSKTFIEHHVLMVHMRTHKMQKRYVCQICNGSFVYYNQLECHARLHTGDNGSLDACEKKKSEYFSNSKRRRHRKIPREEWRHKCNVCNKSFPYKYILMRHQFKHYTERVYQCNVCQKTFLSGKSMKSHIITHEFVNSEIDSFISNNSRGSSDGRAENTEEKTVPTLNKRIRSSQRVKSRGSSRR